VNYSCFDAPTGLYRYFADGSTHPINTDLPIPKLPPKAGKVGVPAREAGRPLPSAAREVGRGLRARGIIVQCDQSALGGWWTELEPASKRNYIVAGIAAVSVLTAAMLVAEKINHRSP